MQNAVLVLGANILIRAVLGPKVRDILLNFNKQVMFLVPDVCIEDAQKYLPIIFEKRHLPYQPALTVLDKLKCLIHIIDKTIYQAHASEAKKRIAIRDIQDWPIVATALTFNSPVWTEDQDFFGSGLPVWTTDRIHLFFESLIK